jgi:hypothetical protein
MNRDTAGERCIANRARGMHLSVRAASFGLRKPMLQMPRHRPNRARQSAKVAPLPAIYIRMFSSI